MRTPKPKLPYKFQLEQKDQEIERLKALILAQYTHVKELYYSSMDEFLTDELVEESELILAVAEESKRFIKTEALKKLTREEVVALGYDPNSLT